MRLKEESTNPSPELNLGPPSPTAAPPGQRQVPSEFCRLPDLAKPRFLIGLGVSNLQRLAEFAYGSGALVPEAIRKLRPDDKEALATLLLEGDSEELAPVLDVLGAIKLLATREGLNLLRDAGAEFAGATVLDRVVYAFLNCEPEFTRATSRALAERKGRLRTYVGFQTVSVENLRDGFSWNSTALLAKLRSDFSQYFVKAEYGGTCRIWHFADQGREGLYIERGDLGKHEAGFDLKDGSPIYPSYRPRALDAVFFDSATNILWVATGDDPDRAFYASALARYRLRDGKSFDQQLYFDLGFAGHENLHETLGAVRFGRVERVTLNTLPVGYEGIGGDLEIKKAPREGCLTSRIAEEGTLVPAGRVAKSASIAVKVKAVRSFSTRIEVRDGDLRADGSLTFAEIHRVLMEIGAIRGNKE